MSIREQKRTEKSNTANGTAATKNSVKISTCYDHATFAWLKETAATESVSIAEVVRRCISFARHDADEALHEKRIHT